MAQFADFSFEVKALGARQFEGHGSVFRNVDHGGDIVVPGAFKRTLARHKADGTVPLMFWMHQPDQVPGVREELREDSDGLYVRGEVLDTQLGNEIHKLLTRKAVRGLSIGYQSVDVDFDADGNRLLKEVELIEVSIVSMAMNPLARVEAAKARLSALGEYVPTEREFEHLLRRAGCSKNVARGLVARVFDDAAGGKPAPRWDAGDEDEAKALLEAYARLQDRVGAQALRRR